MCRIFLQVWKGEIEKKRLPKC